MTIEGQALGTPAYLIDDRSALDPGWFRGDEHVVLSAGASAPEAAVRQIAQRLVDEFAAELLNEPSIHEREPFPLPKEVRQLLLPTVLAN